MPADILETIRFLQNPEDSYRFQNTPPTVHFLNQMYPFNIYCHTSSKYLHILNFFLSLKSHRADNHNYLYYDNLDF